MSEMPKEPMGEETPDNNEISENSEIHEADEADGENKVTDAGSDGIPAVDDAIIDNAEPPKKKPKKISVFTFVLTTVSLVLAAVMITYTASSAYYRQKLVDIQIGQAESEDAYVEKGFPFALFSQFIDAYTFEEADEDAMMASALKAYVEATGDRYAYYYTAEEYAEYQQANAGQTEGIGINIIYTEAPVKGKNTPVIKVINVIEDSPAASSGLRVGDLIYGVGIDKDMKTVAELGYDIALSSLKGEAGTDAAFTVWRPDGDASKELEFSIKRAAVTSESVYSRVHSSDPSVGIVKILQFDLTTPKNFTAAMDELIEAGCTKFVFDVRYNPGGDLKSIQAVLSYFLHEGDVVIRTTYKDGTEKIDKVAVAEYGDSYAGCSVSKEDIGKYRRDGFEFAVLCNGSTASAAELFTATFRDYGLGTIVGTTTYGKGSMQSIFSLWRYGYSGALKLTVAKYFSGANGGYNDGYDGIGIEPDAVCELSEEAASKNIYELSDDEDDQLKKALESFE